MASNLKNQQHLSSSRCVGMVPVFAVLGICCLGFGSLSLPTAVFVGPQVLVMALGNVFVGVVSLLIAIGLKRQNEMAWWGGLILIAAILIVAIIAFVQSAIAGEKANSIFFAVLFIVSGSILFALAISRNGKASGQT